MLSQFSPVAFTGSTLLLLTGATAAWWYLGELSNLWTTSYGRLLLLKLFLVAAAAACGFVNWQALRRPSTSTDRGALAGCSSASKSRSRPASSS